MRKLATTSARPPVLPGYPIPEFWVKLLMPKNRIEKPAALSLIGILKEGFGQTILPQANG
jgi:hypothetical protein